jgi:chromosome segregation ATPase
MGFSTGSVDERKKRLKALMRDRKYEVREHELNDEIRKISVEIYQLQERVRQLEDELSRITSALGNPQNQPQWSQLEQQKLRIEGELERLANIELRDAKELLNDLEKFSGFIRKEKRTDRRAA